MKNIVKENNLLTKEGKIDEENEEKLRRNSKYPKRNIEVKIYKEKEHLKRDHLFCKFSFLFCLFTIAKWSSNYLFYLF